MNLTKEQISDLNSLHDRVVNCTLDNERTLNALKEAKRQFDDFLWRLQHGKVESQIPQEGK